jgi:putative transposase
VHRLVHRLVGGDPQVGIHRLVKRLKGHAVHAVREAFPALKRRRPSLGTNRSVVAPTGGVTLEPLKRSGHTQQGTSARAHVG